MHGMRQIWRGCAAAIGVTALASAGASGQDLDLPRCATFELDAEASSVAVELFVGSSSSPLHGRLTLGLGDPVFPTSPPAVNVSIGANDLVAADWTPQLNVLDDPFLFRLEPATPIAGAWDPGSGTIGLTVNLFTPDFPPPVGLPIILTGTLTNGQLSLSGDNGNVADGRIEIVIEAREIECRREVFFSTEVGFTTENSTGVTGSVSNGDALSVGECVVATNNELTQLLGFKPVAPDVGLDALTHVNGPVLFSTEVDEFSVIYGPVRHGDLVSSEGVVVRTNQELIDAFSPAPVTGDVGLDGAHLGFVFTALTNGGLFFSTEVDFFSQTLASPVRHGDILHEDGWVFRSNQSLMGAFSPFCLGPCPADYGLDAFYIFETGEVWFSTEEGFIDTNLGPIDDGAVLSSEGYVVAGNLDLLFGACQPLEDLSNFGLDALDVETCKRCHIPCIADLNDDGDVNAADLAILLGLWGMIGTNADLDLNGVVGAGDLAILIGEWGPCPS